MKNPLAFLAALALVAAVRAQSGATAAIHTETLVIRGRFVDAEGKAIRRCTVRLTGHQSTGYDLAWAAGDWKNPPEITTAEDGEFRFSVRLPAPDEARDRNRYHIECSHAKYAPWFSHCTFEVAAALGGVDYGDISLPLGVRPRIRCVDTHGAPQSGVTLWLKPLRPVDALVATPEFGPHSWVTRGIYGTTDIDGVLHLEDPAVPAECSLSVQNRPVHQVPESVMLSSKEVIEAVVAAVPADSIIEGRIVDAHGEPVEGALLAASGEGGPSGRARRDGRFTLLRDAKTQGDTAIVHMAKNRRYDDWTPLATIAWGSRDANIEVPAAAAVTFEVRNTSGAPVEDFNLYCLPTRTQATEVGVRRSGTFAGGCVTCELAPGPYRVLVYPHNQAALPSEWTVIEVADKNATQRIVLEAPQQRSVRLTIGGQGAGGKPAVGALVEVILGPAPQPFEFVRPATANVGRDSRGGSLLVASSRSDAQGNAVLFLPKLDGTVHLRITGPDTQTMVVPVDMPLRDEPLVIDLVPGARISGVLAPLAAVLALDPEFQPDARANIYSHQRRYGATITAVSGPFRREGILVDHRGNFSVGGLPPGPVDLSLHTWVKNGNSRRRAPDPLPLGTFPVDLAKPLAVELTLPQR